MVEQIIAVDFYELIKALPSVFDPRVFEPSGLRYFRLTKAGDGVFNCNPDGRIFHDDKAFMESLGLDWDAYIYIAFDPQETVMGFVGDKVMAEYIWNGQNWVLKVFEAYRRPVKTPAELRFAIDQDYANLKKFLF